MTIPPSSAQPARSPVISTSKMSAAGPTVAPVVPPVVVEKEKQLLGNNKNAKDGLRDPPLRIRNPATGMEYTRAGYLGEGGFARVWSFLSPDGRIHAAKTVPLATITSASKKTKLYIEIKVHQLFQHPNICRFDDVFQDEENVYIMLEICGGGNMMELLKRRKRYTEPEARYFLVQIISAVNYMHTSANVMHRDLKLGNIFLDESMNVKLGDFGLAAVVENEGDRRRTMCGTPNYIAPEVITKKGKGHSYECDVWGIGVILYTMLIGKPPFQCSSVNDIYKRIRELDYHFPEKAPISSSAKHLIQSILTTDPKLRPSLTEILSDPWFTAGAFPPRLSRSTVEQPQDWAHLTTEQSRANFQNAKTRARFDHNLPINLPKPSSSKFRNALEARQALGGAIAQQERDFEKAIHPDSPIAALLLSARKAPVVPPANMMRDPPPVMGRLQTATRSRGSPLRRELKAMPSRARAPARSAAALYEEDLDEIEEGVDEDNDAEERPGQKNGRTAASRVPSNVLSPSAGRKFNVNRHADAGSGASSAQVHVAHSRKVSRVRSEMIKSPVKKRPDGEYYLRMLRNLEAGLGFKGSEEKFTHSDMPLQPEPPKIFISCWLDYVQKYGMGFAMTDGSIGVLLNDCTAMVASRSAGTLDYLTPLGRPAHPLEPVQYRRDEYITAEIKDDPEMKERIHLLSHFKEYIEKKLYGDYSYNYEGTIEHGMVYLAKFWRTKNVVTFRLSNDVLQFNYHDHTKLIFSQDGLVITYVDTDYRLWNWNLATLVSPPGDEVSGREKRRMDAALRKVEYAKEIICKLDRAPQGKTSSLNKPASSARKIEGGRVESDDPVAREIGVRA